MTAGIIFALGVLFAIPPASASDSFEPHWRHLKSTLSNQDLYRLIWALPKGGDLHNHHEYSIPMSFWLEGAARHGYLTRTKLSSCGESEAFQWLTLRPDSVKKLSACAQRDFTPVSALTEPQRKAWLAALTLDPTESRDEFFDRLVRRLGDLERDPKLMGDALVIAQTQLQSENALYLETQLDPREFHGLTEDQGAAAIRSRLARQDSLATRIPVRMQVSALRFLPGAENDLRDGFAFVQRNRDLWVGVNLVGREDNPDGRPARFATALRQLRQNYPSVHLSLHAGESSQADSHVLDTLHLGAERIGHGTNAYLDPEAMKILREGRRLVEVSLTSNLALGYVSDLRRHPFPTYLRQGIPVCLNTDDRGVMDSNLTDEYFAAISLFDLSWDEVVQIGRWSLEFSFAEAPLKKELLTRYAANVAEFERAFSAADWRQTLSRIRPQPSGTTPRLLHLRQPGQSQPDATRKSRPNL
ncbi:MAG: adenosine deaminase [Acidobacteria bacterium]|nr:adenosine deaminase [Acidobacteriota bacterium]